MSCPLGKQLVHNFTVEHSSILFDCIPWCLPLQSMTHRNYHIIIRPVLNEINRKMPKNMKDVKKSMFGCTHFEVPAGEQKFYACNQTLVAPFTLEMLLTFSKSCVSDMLQVTVISMFCFCMTANLHFLMVLHPILPRPFPDRGVIYIDCHCGSCNHIAYHSSCSC